MSKPPAFASSDTELAAIDRSTRWPVVACFVSAVHWLVVGTLLLVYALSLRHPGNGFPILDLFTRLSEQLGIFTYGRVWATAIDSLVYGWASTLGLGFGLWLFARLSRVPLRYPSLVLLGIAIWNLGIATGLTSIFLGESTSFELLEFPYYASLLLFVGYLIIAVWGVILFLQRPAGREYISQAWLLLAFFAFPWLYANANYLLVWYPVLDTTGTIQYRGAVPGAGVAQSLVAAWFYHGLLKLWIVPISLAVLYYLISKISGLTHRYYSWTVIAFWAWVALAPWTGVHDLVGGPFPAWLVNVGLLFSGLLIFPVALISLNLILTAAKAEENNHGQGLIMPFLFLGSVMFAVGGIFELLMSVRGINTVLRFSMFREAIFFIWVYGCFSFTAFGALYYIIPRLFDFGWRSSLWIKAHFYASVYGILLVIVMFGIGGILQGLTLENTDPTVTIVTANQISLSFFIGGTMCISLVSLGNGIFALHFGWFLLDWLRSQIRTNATAAELFFEPYLPESPSTDTKTEAQV